MMCEMGEEKNPGDLCVGDGYYVMYFFRGKTIQ